MVNNDPDLPQTGRFVGREHRFPVRVYFEDTDVGGVVYHASYLRFLERARADMLGVAGIDQRAAHADGTGIYAVSDVHIRYRRPARFDDALLVVSRVAEARAASCAIQQTVMRDGETVADADVIAVFLSMDGRPRRQPAAWIETFRRLQGEPAVQ